MKTTKDVIGNIEGIENGERRRYKIIIREGGEKYAGAATIIRDKPDHYILDFEGVRMPGGMEMMKNFIEGIQAHNNAEWQQIKC